MEVVKVILMGIATISGIGLVIAVALQTSKADSFSAAMGSGGGDASRFRKGSREEMLERLTKVAAVVWISSCALYAIAHNLAG